MLFFKPPVSRFNKFWFAYEYKHTTIAILIILAFVLFLDTAIVASTLSFIEHLGYFGAFLAGALSVSFFTVTPAVVIFLAIASGGDINPLLLGLVTAAGMTFGDWLILKFLNDRVFYELKPLLLRIGVVRLFDKLRGKKSMSWLLVVVGALLVATPMPDEAGLTLMGLSNLRRGYTYIVLFFLNLIGTLAFITTIRSLT